MGTSEKNKYFTLYFKIVCEGKIVFEIFLPKVWKFNATSWHPTFQKI
jgi:hypothetical protein